MTDTVADILARVQQANQHIGYLLIDTLNDTGTNRAQRLREIGQHLGSLSAECLGRATDIDGHHVDTPPHMMIDAHE